MNAGTIAVLLAALGYAQVYFAIPDRRTWRNASGAGVRQIWAGLGLWFGGGLMGSFHWGVLMGPIVVLFAGLLVGTALVPVVPVVRLLRNRRSGRAGRPS